jgi:hypothetical protein
MRVGQLPVAPPGVVAEVFVDRVAEGRDLLHGFIP